VAGTVFISVTDDDKAAVVPVARQFNDLGFTILATSGTFTWLQDHGIAVRHINKLAQGRPHVEDAIKNGEIHLVINTGTGGGAHKDGFVIRRAALKFAVPYVTTVAGALAVSKAVMALKTKALTVNSLQEYHEVPAPVTKTCSSGV
jgi:carbamoyl-phosphate synthase large subunit